MVGRAEIFDLDEVRAHLKSEVREAGGVARYTLRNRLDPLEIANALNNKCEPSAAILAVLGFQRANLFYALPPTEIADV